LHSILANKGAAMAGSNEIPARPDWWGDDLNGAQVGSGAAPNPFPLDPNDPDFQPPTLEMNPSTMGASDKLKDYLRAREVYKAHVYNDNPQHPESGTRTIGYGHTVNVDAIASQYPQGLPESAARSILDADLAPVEEAVRNISRSRSRKVSSMHWWITASVRDLELLPRRPC
jgi:hypothetical protein